MSEYDRLLIKYQAARLAQRQASRALDEADAAVEEAWQRINELLESDSSANTRPARAAG